MPKRKQTKEQKTKNYLIDLAIRLFIALILAIGSLGIFYSFFTALTVWPSYWLLKLFYPIIKQGNFFFYSQYAVEIISACIGGSAYYLLAILNLTTKSLSWLTRLYAFLFSAFSFLIINIIRIVLLAAILFSGSSQVFNQLHIAFWIIGSTLIVVLIWLLTVKVFAIKEVPVYSDIREILKLFKKQKKKQRKQ